MSQKIPNNMCNLSIFYLGFLAQLEERLSVKQNVIGSIPIEPVNSGMLS